MDDDGDCSGCGRWSNRMEIESMDDDGSDMSDDGYCESMDDGDWLPMDAGVDWPVERRELNVSSLESMKSWVNQPAAFKHIVESISDICWAFSCAIISVISLRMPWPWSMVPLSRIDGIGAVLCRLSVIKSKLHKFLSISTVAATDAPTLSVFSGSATSVTVSFATGNKSQPKTFERASVR